MSPLWLEAAAAGMGGVQTAVSRRFSDPWCETMGMRAGGCRQRVVVNINRSVARSNPAGLGAELLPFLPGRNWNRTCRRWNARSHVAVHADSRPR